MDEPFMLKGQDEQDQQIRKESQVGYEDALHDIAFQRFEMARFLTLYEILRSVRTPSLIR